MTGFTEVQTILDAATTAIVGIPTAHNENERLKASPITSFTRTTLAPGETIPESIGACGTDRLNGLYVVDMFYPKNDGVADPNADVDLVTVAFESGTILTSGADSVEIFNSYPIGSTPNLEKFYQKQVIVEWRARRSRTA